LKVEDHPNGGSKVVFNVGMARTLAVEPASIDKLTGIYVHEKDPNKTLTLFNNQNSIWIKMRFLEMDLSIPEITYLPTLAIQRVILKHYNLKSVLQGQLK
jgi:hypothetical protein